jgi:hypothetical protein
MNKKELVAKTKTELMKLAKRLGLRGISTLAKGALVRKIESAKQNKTAHSKRKTGGVARKITEIVKRRAIRKRKVVVPAKPSRKVKAPAEKPVSASAATELVAHKFDLSNKPKPTRRVPEPEQLGELPEAYGTGRLFLTARDPHWLYAYWDLTGQQMSSYRQRAVDGRLVLRVFEQNHAAPLHEFTIHHDTRNWYIPVHKPAATYTAQLGYWLPDANFFVVSQSRGATTQSAVVSADTTVRFATIPLEVPLPQLLELIRTRMAEGEPLAEALHRLQATGTPFPFKVSVEVGPWTPEQVSQLEHILAGDVMRKIPVGSAEISEWLRRRLAEQLGSAVSGGFSSPGGASWSGAPGKGFWFAVNAELMIYGATEPNAKVTVDGQPVALNSDGTFMFHYEFPNGQFRVPVAAGDDQRAAELKFERRTTTQGEVGVAGKR